jgi:hypothetical protein
MEQAIRQVITAAVHRVKSKEYEVTPEDPVQTFLDDLFAELFPVVPNHTETQSVEVPVVAVKEKKQRKKKEVPTPEPAAAPSQPTEVAAPAPEPAAPTEVAVPTEVPAPAPVKKQRKKKETPAPAEVPAPAPAEAPAEAPEPEKKQRKKKEFFGNVDKLTPTLKKQVKKIADELKVGEPDLKGLLEFLNHLQKEEFDGKTFEEHVRMFLRPVEVPAPAAEEEEQEMDCIEVEFEGKTYYVDTTTQRVYEPQGEANVAVGYVGMAAFEKMIVPGEDA